MSVDQRLRNGLARIASDVTVKQSAALEVVQGRARRQGRIVRTAQVLAVAAVLAVGMLVAVPLGLGRPPSEPAVPPGTELDGTYVVDVADTTANLRMGVAGRWVVTLRPNGGFEVIPPDTYQHPHSGITYRVEGDQLRTDALVSSPGCQAAGTYVGTYRWTRTDSNVRFVLVSDACPARMALFTGQDWEIS